MIGMIIWRIGFDKEWWNDGGMKEIFELRVLPWFRIIPHFTVIHKFLNDENAWNELKMKGMSSKWCPLHWNSSSLVISSSVKWCWNDRMRWNDVVFWGQQKNWILRHLSFGCHLIIPTSFRDYIQLKRYQNKEWSSDEEEWVRNGLIGCCLFWRDSTRLKYS